MTYVAAKHSFRIWPKGVDPTLPPAQILASFSNIPMLTITDSRIGIKTDMPAYDFDVKGSFHAGKIYGDGSELSGLRGVIQASMYASNVYGLVASATTDTTNAANITVGTLNTAVLPLSGVSAGPYGGATHVPSITIDSYGRITNATNVDIANTTNAANITTGTLNVERLPTSGVVAGTYANATTIPVITVDSYGRVTTITNTAAAINATTISSGTLNSERLPTSGAFAGSYGTASATPVLTVDTYGRITTVTNTNIAIASTAVSGLAASATTDTTNATNISIGTLNTARLPSSGVTNATYGSASTVPVLAIDTYGRVTNAVNVSVSLTSSVVSGLVASATTDTTNATNIRTGTLNASRLEASGVTALRYGGANNVASFQVDTYGRITSATNVAIAITSSAVSGLVASATTDTTNATNIGAGTLNSFRLETSGVTALRYGGATNVASFQVDTYGRITSATNAAIAISSSVVSGLVASATTDTTNATNISAGTLNASRLEASGVTALRYGGATNVASFQVDSYGRIISATNAAIAISSSAVSGLVASATTDATNATNIGVGTLNSFRLETSGVTASRYGGATNVASFQVDTYGRITSATNAAIAISYTAVTGLVTSATTDTTNATNISSGTLNTARLPSSSVNAAVYGSGTIVPVLTVDSYGRITSATNVSITASSTFQLNGTTAYYTAGNVGIGTSTANTMLHIYRPGGTSDIIRVEDSTAPDTTPFILDKNGNVGIGVAAPANKLEVNGAILASGDIIGFGTVSDQMFKKDIMPITDGLDKISQLEPVEYVWNEKVFNETKRGQKDCGFIAQQVEPVLPLVIQEIMVPDTNESLKGVRYDRIVPYLVKAIQELERRLIVLENHSS
jgi:hypothetical protein